jgi:hypothetical protein
MGIPLVRHSLVLIAPRWLPIALFQKSATKAHCLLYVR